MKRWSVAKRDGVWRVYDRGVWHDSYETLVEAHTDATCNAVADVLYAPGGLSCLARLLKAGNDRSVEDQQKVLSAPQG